MDSHGEKKAAGPGKLLLNIVAGEDAPATPTSDAVQKKNVSAMLEAASGPAAPALAPCEHPLSGTAGAAALRAWMRCGPGAGDEDEAERFTEAFHDSATDVLGGQEAWRMLKPCVALLSCGAALALLLVAGASPAAALGIKSADAWTAPALCVTLASGCVAALAAQRRRV